MSTSQLKEAKVPSVVFVGDDDVLSHILDREGGTKLKKEKAQLLVNPQKVIKKAKCELEKSDLEVLEDQNYVEVLGRNIQESLGNGSAVDDRNKVYSFQHRKHPEEMTKLGVSLCSPGCPGTHSVDQAGLQLRKPPASASQVLGLQACPTTPGALELAKTSGKIDLPDSNDPEITKNIARKSKGHSTSEKAPLQNNNKNEFLSSQPHNLRKRLIASRPHCDSESEYSASSSEDDEEVAKDDEEGTSVVRFSQKSQAQKRLLPATLPKKRKRDKASDLVEEYFEAHSSSKVLTSDRTLQKLKRARVDQCLGFNIVLYGLGSKRDLLEKFRTTMLQDSIHVVINGFFPGISVKSILNSITEDVLGHMGTFQSALDQRDCIINRFKEDSSLELFLLIHNLDSQMLRGDNSQQILGQLSSLHNVYLIASIDHLNAPLMWDHAKQSLYNWLWYETTTYSPYTEETSYENSLLVKQSGSLPLSSLIHVLRSLTPNARGIFRLLMKFQLDNQDSPSYIGLSFQDFYQQCREAFLVNSDLTLRAQLTEFRDHKLIRTKKGTDGVEYLLIPVDSGTLADFLEKEEEEA
ncbi:Origin recognition complex subunit 2 [Apodemus speciosus]|uniref:Origin recognition complex subunit 2 n=1 Tax=Apodemus speciosus TaxID=105296 RepID=A0ABQ0ED48_APOSI